jgi:hypothetical protein
VEDVVGRCSLLLLASALGGCMDCTIEAYVDQFFDQHHAIDCKFAHRISSSGEQSLVGAEPVRDCIAGALENSRAFVGGYFLAGVDSSTTIAYLGTPSGEIHLVEENWFDRRSLRSSRCSSLVVTGLSEDNFGISCVGAELEPLCSE